MSFVPENIQESPRMDPEKYGMYAAKREKKRSKQCGNYLLFVLNNHTRGDPGG